MTPLDQKVLALLTARPMSESSIEAALGQDPGVGAMHPEIIATALRRLRASGAVLRDDHGYFTTIERTSSPASAEAQAPVAPAKGEPVTNATAKKCKKCGGADFTDAGTCRPCKAASNRAYLARKAGGGSAVKGPTKKPNGKQELASSSMGKSDAAPAVIASGYTLQIPDHMGKIHAIPVTLQTILALHEKLEELV